MKLIKINKVYKVRGGDLHILKDINMEFEKGKFYAIMGRSGSGKSTLVNILGLLDDYTSGEYYLNGINTNDLNDDEKSEIRGLKIGFVFQSFYLNNNLTAIENVMLPMFINHNIKKDDRKSIAFNIMRELGIDNRAKHKPKELSGGEQQRVAIARALVNNPSIIIADEPTGNLDEENEKKVLDILKDISKKGKIVIVVSHNPIIKDYADIIYEISNGNLKEVSLWSY